MLLPHIIALCTCTVPLHLQHSAPAAYHCLIHGAPNSKSTHPAPPNTVLLLRIIASEVCGVNAYLRCPCTSKKYGAPVPPNTVRLLHIIASEVYGIISLFTLLLHLQFGIQCSRTPNTVLLTPNPFLPHLHTLGCS